MTEHRLKLASTSVSPGHCTCGVIWPCLSAYKEAILRRDAGKATLGDAVLIARGRPGPPADPIAFANSGGTVDG
jgi:hypothetical protein